MPIITTQFPASINVANLNGVNGFLITEFPAHSEGGNAISGMGDLNADGIADLVIGTNSGNTAYVIFGQSGIGSGVTLDITNLNGSNGFVINGLPGTGTKNSFSSAGDVNADGISDLLIGVPYASASPSHGACYVIFGQSGIGSNGTLSVTTLTGSNGFAITGLSSEGGYSVSNAGDINADGISDLIIGVPGYKSNEGGAHVIFGQSGIGSNGTLSVATLTGSNGFTITGYQVNGGTGSSVSSAGDVNADGISDLIIAAPSASSSPYSIGTTEGVVCVIFGKSGIGSTGTFSLSPLTGSNGFTIRGFREDSEGGSSVSVGDINGDGVSDLLIGAPLTPAYFEGAIYVVFGKSGIGSTGTFSVTTLTGSNGFIISGFQKVSEEGSSVSIVGDFNGDGVSDFIFMGDALVSYLIFGKSDIGSTGTFSAATLTGSNGVIITGFPTSSSLSCRGVGDINNDGLIDLAIGVPDTSSYTGATYIIFGQPTSYNLVHNHLILNEGQTLVFDSQFLNVTIPITRLKDSVLQFNVTGIQHGRFFASSNPGVTLRSFLQQQVRSGQIEFAHDGSEWAPAYNVSISYPGLFILPTPHQAAVITFQQSFVLVNNSLTVNQGQTVILNTNNLSAKDLDVSGNNPSLIFSVTGLQHGYFALTNVPTTPITHFTQAQLQSGSIQFVHDGTITPPSYSVTVIDGIASIAAQAVTVSFDVPPTLLTNTLTINQGQTVVLGTTNLNASDAYTSSFTFLTSNVQHGYFALISAPSTPINSFTQIQVQNGGVQFVHDGSTNPPTYAVAVNDGRMTSSPQVATISFDVPPALTANTLTVNQGQTVVLSTINLNASDTYTSSFTFIVSNVAHGYFALTSAPLTPITSFTQTQVQNAAVQFVQDGTSNPPSYDVAVSDGRMTSSPQAAAIFFDVPPTLITNTLTVYQSQTVVLSAINLSATDTYTSTFTFTVSNVQYGYFALTNAPSIPVNSFTQAQVQNGEVQFVQDGSTNPPSYTVAVSDGRMTSSAQAAIISFDVLPTLVANTLTINQGQTVVLNTSNLDATHPLSSSFTFTVSNVVHGYFALTSAPTTPITSFTQAQIQSGVVQFVQDGTNKPPFYDVTVSDGRATTSPQPSTISFDIPPTITANALTIYQGQTVIITPNILSASDPYTSQFTFTISNVKNGQFSLTSNPTVAVTSFTQAQIQAGEVIFMHDGSHNAPSYSVSVSDGRISSVGGLQTASINLIEIPEITINQLDISQGEAVILGPSDLSAIDPGTSTANLTFIASAIHYGHFEDISQPSFPIIEFQQQKITDGGIKFIADGSSIAPAYNISVSNGVLSSPSTAASIYFIPQAAASGSSDSTVRNAIIGGTVSGSLSLLFLFLKLYITKRATTNLQKAIEGGESDVEKQQATHYKEVVRPIASKVFETINTTGFLGYRSEKDAKAYMAAIESIIAKLENLGVNINLKDVTAAQRSALINEIAKQTRKIVVPVHGLCSTATLYHFFKPEATPLQIEEKANAIAEAVQKGLSSGPKLASISVQPSPVSTSVSQGKVGSPASAGIELSDVKSYQLPLTQ